MRKFGKIGIVALVVAAGIWGLTWTAPATFAQPPAIKIGVMFPLTGPLASQGLPDAGRDQAGVR